MSEPTKAVFLSYASQDAEAAKRICDALRQAGVEVWFDAEGGLEHGDEWDAKIRRQIKECVLFIAIISANTQAREEGYFRIEWDLAAERARGIASGVAFILPVVIDDTKESAALVPDRFRTVQWTRLPAGIMPPEVLQRLLKLWSHRAGVVKFRSEQQGTGSREPEHPEPPAPRLSPPAKSRLGPVLGIALGLAALGIAAYVFLGRRAPTAPPATIASPAAPVSPAADYPRDPELRRARTLLHGMDAIPEDFRLAEDILQPVLAKQPNDPETATVAAELALEFLVRGFDNSQARRGQAQRLTERAVQLAPDNPYALGALSRYLLFVGAQMARAEELIRQAIALRPDEPRFHRTLHYILFVTQRTKEADALGERMAVQFPRDPLVQYDIARRFKDANDLVQMEKWFDRTLALEPPVAFALIWKAWIAVWAHGDLAAMKQWIDRVPERQRNNTRVVNARYVHALLSGETRQAQRALNELTDEWLTDFDFTGPKALLVGNLALLDGRTDLARVHFDAALAAAVAEAEKTPTDLRPQRARMWALMGLGRREEARALQRLLLQSLPRPFRIDMSRATWTNPITSCLLLDFRAEALALLRDSSDDANCRRILRNMFKLDPRLKPWRDDAEINALLRDPAPVAPGGSTPDDKSVAVLAFANLSDDKANEYFSDGISEELLNVLAKVPDLKVTARTSSFHFKGKDTPIPEIARQLGVAYVVEGSVRKAGDKVRITAQLIKAADGFHVWSDTFTRDLKDIFAVQDEIAGLIAKSLSLKIGAGSAVAPVAPTVNPEAYRLYLEGRAAWNRRDAAGFQQAELLLNQAIELEPRFARAHAALADVWAMRSSPLSGSYSQRQSPSSIRIIAKARQAVELDENSAEAHASLGNSLARAWLLEEALRELRRAVELNPNYASAHQWLGRALFVQGRLDEGLAALRRAAELDPLSHRILDNYSDALKLAGRLSEAWTVLGRAAALHPAGVQIRCKQALVLAGLGRRAEALAAARALAADANAEESDYRYSTAVGVFSALGETAEAEALIRRIEPDSEDMPVALAYAGRGREFIQRLDDLTINWVENLWFDPVLAPLRADPKFREWVRKVGLADALARGEGWSVAHPPEQPEAKQ